MTEYTFSEARQKLASILDKARREGSVRIRRRDGQVFVVKPERASQSPLDVSALDLQMERSEILDVIGESRRKESGG